MCNVYHRRTRQVRSSYNEISKHLAAKSLVPLDPRFFWRDFKNYKFNCFVLFQSISWISQDADLRIMFCFIFFSNCRLVLVFKSFSYVQFGAKRLNRDKAFSQYIVIFSKKSKHVSAKSSKGDETLNMSCVHLCIFDYHSSFKKKIKTPSCEIIKRG